MTGITILINKARVERVLVLQHQLCRITHPHRSVEVSMTTFGMHSHLLSTQVNDAEAQINLALCNQQYEKLKDTTDVKVSGWLAGWRNHPRVHVQHSATQSVRPAGWLWPLTSQWKAKAWLSPSGINRVLEVRKPHCPMVYFWWWHIARLSSLPPCLISCLLLSYGERCNISLLNAYIDAQFLQSALLPEHVLSYRHGKTQLRLHQP